LNPIAEALTGWKQEEAAGKELTKVFNLINEETRGLVENPVSRALREGVVVGLANHTLLISKEGREIPIDDSAAPIMDTEGNISGVVAVFHDISERRKAEQALRESESKFRVVFENSPNAIFITDPESLIILDCNSKACEMNGYSRNELIGQNINMLHTAETARQLTDPSYHKKQMENLRCGAVVADGIHRRKDGSLFPIETSMRLIELAGQEVVIGIDQDVSQRKMAEEALRENEAYLSFIFENVPAGILVIDCETRKIFDVNTVAAGLIGLPKEKIVGEVCHQYICPRCKKECPVLDLGQNIDNSERALLKATGEQVPVIKTATRAKIKNRDYLIEIFHDITQQKRAEEEKALLEEQVRRSQKLETIGTLAGGIAHDFNNILTPIMGYADMALSNLKETEPLYRDLQQVLKAAHRAKGLVEQILLFAKQSEKAQEPLYLQPLVEEALKLLRPSIPTTIEIRQRIDASCGKALADATQIHQVIVNLCTNAWQAMEKKGGTLTIELKPAVIDAAGRYPNLTAGEYIRLSVIDSGTGMDKPTLERIYEPFFTTKAVDKGTGLGLSVVHGIVRSHRGDIQVESKPGKGSAFHVYLPAFKAANIKTETKSTAITGGQESILVVDDEENIADLIKKMLDSFGYTVEVCHSSIEALKVFRRQPDKFDLLISDLTMPDMTGLDLAKQAQVISPGFPVMIMTGYGDSLNEDTCKRYGIKQVLGKPLAISELAAAVRSVLDN
jgi:PAS domain S-box-containing protein